MSSRNPGSFLINIQQILTSNWNLLLPKLLCHGDQAYSSAGRFNVSRSSINIQIVSKIINQGNRSSLVLYLDFYKDEPAIEDHFFVIDSQKW